MSVQGPWPIAWPGIADSPHLRKIGRQELCRAGFSVNQRRLVVKYRRHYFARMSATLTVNLDSEILQLAEQEARARHTTLAEIVAQQLRVMARNWQDSRAGKTPLTDALRGAVKLPPDFDERTGLTEELQKKHGLGG